MTYTILDDGAAIDCHLCHAISANPNDVLHRYCPKCHRFHEDQLRLALDFVQLAVQALRPDLDAREQEELGRRTMAMIAPQPQAQREKR